MTEGTALNYGPRFFKVVYSGVVIVALQDSELGAHTRGSQDPLWTVRLNASRP